MLNHPAVFALPVRVINWADDRLNPIVVKELRQAVKSKVVVSVLMLMLVLLLIIFAVALINLNGPGGFNDSAGADLFLVFQSILLATCVFFVPIYVGVRLGAERASATSDLLYVTTIRPASIIWGKLLAGMVVTALVFSACAPFMVMTYLLRGIDVTTVVFVLALDAFVVLAATQVAIFVATLPIGWPVKLLLGLILLIVAVSVLMATMQFIGMLIIAGVLIYFWSSSSGVTYYGELGLLAGSWLAGVVLVFLLSVAVISPPTSNRALPLRVYLTLIWVASWAGFLALPAGWYDAPAIWAAFALSVLILAVLVSCGEREAVGPRLRRSIPRSALLRIPAFLFYSGAAGGLLWCAILLTLTLAGSFFAQDYLTATLGRSDALDDAWLTRCLSLIAWVYGYVLLSVLVCRRLLKLRNGGPATGVMALILMILASIGPLIVAFALNPQHWDNNVLVYLILNPLGPVIVEDNDWAGTYGTVAFALSLGFATVMLLVNFPWFWKQIKAFHPPPPPPQVTPPQVMPPIPRPPGETSAA